MSAPIALYPRRATSLLDPRNNADAFEIRLLSRAGDISDALRLRQRAYAEHGLVPQIPDAEYRDLFDDLPSTALLGGYDGGRLVATMRLCFSLAGDPLTTLPCEPYYPGLKPLKLAAPKGLVEVSRLAIEPGIGNTSYRATLYGFMVRSAFAAARAADVSTIVVATRAEWVAYYKHLLSFVEVGEPALYPPGGIPISLLAGHIDQAARRARMRNRFFHTSEEDIARMRRMIAPVLGPVTAAVALGGER
jgi:N-acyl-L-homoserine lactone synthetase